jgi:hypothetical protein
MYFALLTALVNINSVPIKLLSRMVSIPTVVRPFVGFFVIFNVPPNGQPAGDIVNC